MIVPDHVRETDANIRMNPEEQQEALTEVGKLLLSTAPANWSEIRYSIHALACFAKSLIEAKLETGENIRLRPPMSMGTRMLELRTAMYRPGQGTWFSANYVITKPSDYTVDFDYDSEPNFSPDAFHFEPTPETYVEDLGFFPRDEEHIPDWLYNKISKTRAANENPFTPPPTRSK
ncbi:hypothetical protein [Actinomadura sp. WAC 06369]|uniref:hypothetical protein n=1 Tax=Actinomadura sp. WAC 06369 TaxID=2203193 RepID=UPI000F79D22C|nr:hypothetical protein [Actinomadura sp. WAC 06369]RSN43871.1 hypothetical protein DMH08_37560 [Actinomadura sp. WAC 06369]